MSEYDLDPLSDQQILAKLAGRLRSERLQRNVTQQALADLAGVGVATLRRFEGGEGNLSLLNLIAVLRALGLVHLLDAFQRSAGAVCVFGGDHGARSSACLPACKQELEPIALGMRCW